MELNHFPNYTFPKEYVLVKTHCGGRCESCGPSKYAETSYSFRRACRRGQKRVVTKDGETMHTRTHYPATRVSKAIHLVRDPFDNVVSRFHMETRSSRSATMYNRTKESFRSYCQVLNDRFEKDEAKSILFDPTWLELMGGVPCRADFFRWIEWHNQAFHLTDDMGLDTLILDYGNYSTDFALTCNTLLEFLHLTRREDPEPFVQGKVYHIRLDLLLVVKLF